MVRVPLDLRAKSFITMGMHTFYMGKFMVCMVWSTLLIFKKFIIYIFILLLQMIAIANVVINIDMYYSFGIYFTL